MNEDASNISVTH